jgi:hypothetical protein
MEEETNPNLKKNKKLLLLLLRFHILWSVNMGTKPLQQGEGFFHLFNNPLALQKDEVISRRMLNKGGKERL